MDKKFRNGLVLGKFMPPQNGHLYLIDTAASQCNMLHVMICSDETQPIPGQLRYNWLKEIYKHNRGVKIIWCQDPNPQYPEFAESVESFYLDYWVSSVYSYIKDLDVVFTSELYGDEFASYLNVKHVMVDQPRETYAVSATAIRNDPFGNWNFIPDVVKHYYMKKVVIMGPESVGKSTLTEKLAKHFNAPFVEEFGRTYSEQKGSEPWDALDFEVIAFAHQMLIKDVTPGKLVIVDTEAMTTKIFGEMYLEKFESDIVDEIIEGQDFDLYLLLDIDIPWVDDSTRLFEAKREGHLKRIKAELEDRGIPYTLIGGSYEERLEEAINAIESIL